VTEILATNESGGYNTLINRLTVAQAQVVESLVNRYPAREPLFDSFKPFTGVFLLDPWKPDARQSA
jgi:hypothetical protein